MPCIYKTYVKYMTIYLFVYPYIIFYCKLSQTFHESWHRTKIPMQKANTLTGEK